MSSYRGNGESCPHCGLTYRQLRTGLNYRRVFEELWSIDASPETWRYKRRRTVLGRWHGTKKLMWKMHLEGCAWSGADVEFARSPLHSRQLREQLSILPEEPPYADVPF